MTRIFSLLILIAAVSLSALGQAGVATSEIKGRVTDPNGAVFAERPLRHRRKKDIENRASIQTASSR